MKAKRCACEIHVSIHSFQDGPTLCCKLLTVSHFSRSIIQTDMQYLITALFNSSYIYQINTNNAFWNQPEGNSYFYGPINLFSFYHVSILLSTSQLMDKASVIERLIIISAFYVGWVNNLKKCQIKIESYQKILLFQRD